MRDVPVRHDSQLTRRDVCKGLARISGALLGSTLPIEARAQVDLRQKVGILSHPPSQGDFYHAQLRRSENGVLDTALRIDYARCRVGDKEAWLRCYDGEPVGPTLRLRRGETLKLRVENHLPVEDGHPSSPGHGGAHRSFNTTNVHFHGLHVSPQYRADNVLLELLPRGSSAPKPSRNTAVGAYEYLFTVPDNHPAGTFWYHAHRHGSTAIQVASMMAGALIVEGDIDDVPEIESAQEFIFLFQQIPFALDNTDGLYKVESFEDLEINWLSVRFTTVNGIQNPTIRMKAGEVQRWRFVNAGLFSPLTIQVVDGNGDPQVTYPIAFDGIPLGTITPQSAPLPTMGPGNRIDVLFKAPGPGTYYLYKTDDRGFLRAGLRPREDPHRLATILVGEERQEMAIPPAASMRELLRPAAISAPEAGPFVERVEFDIRGDRYVVNGAPFDPLMAPRTLVLNNVQKWTVRAKGGDHPFHIHVNPFLLIERNGRPLPVPEWRDTVLIRNGESVTFLTRYEDFTGQFVLHCHNLGHEDRGMMELVEVVPPPLQDFAYFTPPFRAPTQRFSDANGRSLSLADFAGRVVLLNFWASSCPPCRDELPRLDDLQRQIEEDAHRRAEERTESGPEPRDFVVLAVSWDADVSAAQRLFEEAGVRNLDVYFDPNRALGGALFGGWLGINALPGTMLIDGDGLVRGVIRRAAPWDAAEARTMIDYFLTA